MLSQSETRTGKKRRSRPAHVGFAGLVIGVALVGRVMAGADWDVSALASFGVEEQQTLTYAEQRVGEVAARPSIGHDGRFFFVLANDPLLLEPQEHARVLDRPTYRSQRMLYPFLAGLGGLLAPTQILWGLVVVNLLSVGAGSLALAGYALRHGLSPWLGLAFPLNPGLISELSIDGAGVLAFALVCGACLALEKDRLPLGLLMLVLAGLTREVMLVAGVGVAIWLWSQGRRKAAWLSVTLPFLAVVGWASYVRLRLPDEPIAEVEELGVPFMGLVEATSIWWESPPHLVAGAVVLICLVLLGSQILRGRSDVLGLATAGFVVLAMALTSRVWAASFDMTRAIAPVLTAVIVNPLFSIRSTPVNSILEA